MPRVNPGSLKQWVTLLDPVPDGTPVTFDPDRIKVAMQALGSAQEGVRWSVTARYHPQVTFNTRLIKDDGQMLNVVSIENVGNADRSGYFLLQCEEVLTP